MDVNYFGTLNAIKAVVPSMIERHHGIIVGVSSAAGILGMFGYTAYSPTKFAVRGLLESLRAEMKPHNVAVHCVFPADIDTPQLEFENRTKPNHQKPLRSLARSNRSRQPTSRWPSLQH